ncbi:hypothetical protein GCM10009554_49040 [Kribbella koreensis]|uniref:Uncharacterized protein n=1 Tax=Kribbella koreensis TaxID=57909 RepID=A0ABP4BIM9_9ACTN
MTAESERLPLTGSKAIWSGLPGRVVTRTRSPVIRVTVALACCLAGWLRLAGWLGGADWAGRGAAESRSAAPSKGGIQRWLGKTDLQWAEAAFCEEDATERPVVLVSRFLEGSGGPGVP